MTLLVAIAAAGLCLVAAAFVGLVPNPWLAPHQGDLGFAPLTGVGLLLLGASAAVAALAVEHGGEGASVSLFRRVDLLIAAAVSVLIAVAALAGDLAGSSAPIGLAPGTWHSVAAAAVVMAVVLPSAIWLVRSSDIRWSPRADARIARTEVILLVAIVVAFGFVVGLGMLQRLPFGWDESVYALTTRHWVQGTPDTGWGIHRPPALSILGVIPLLFTSSETGFRLIGLAFGCAAVAGAWLLGRRLGGSLTGLLAAVIVASSTPIQIDAGLFLNDVPATGLLLLLMASAWRIMEREQISWAIVWLAPLAALTFYVRYGASISIVAIVIGATIIWPTRLMRAWPKLLVTVGLLLVLLAPHLVFATMNTGAPWGIALLAGGGARPAYPGEALVAYVSWLPNSLVGPLAASAAIAGAAAGVFALVRSTAKRGWNRSSRAIAFLFVPATIQIAVLGMTILPQARYVFFPMACLAIAGVICAARGWEALGRHRTAVARVAVGCLLIYFSATVVAMPAGAAGRGDQLDWIKVGGRYAAQHSKAACSILASNVPQFTWYSGCATYNFGGRTTANRDRLLSSDRWLVVRRDGLFQPSAEIMREYLSRVDRAGVVLLRDRHGVTRGALYRFPTADT